MLGDRVYGPGDAPPLAFEPPAPVSRQMLHAARVRFEEVEAASPDPEDLAAVCRSLRSQR